MDQRHNPPRRSRALWLGVAAVAAVGALLGLTFALLLARVAGRETNAQQAHEVLITVHTLEALEWRAAAGEDVDEIRRKATQQSALLRTLVAQAAEAEPTLRSEAEGFIRAFEWELAAITAGNVTEAHWVDQTAVDPSFERLVATAERVADDQSREAASTLRLVRRLGWLASFAVVVVAGGAVTVGLRARERSRALAARDAADARVRDLVEHAPDVITTVGTDGELTVMSAHLGALAAVVPTGGPRTICDLLPDEQADAWRYADAQLRDIGTDQQIELVYDRGDGTALTFEARGARIGGGECVWIWRDVTERRRLERELSHLAFHDALTNLPNRALLEDRTDRSIARGERSGRPTTVLFIDLDNFKSVNDGLGHAAGDELLQVVARRLAGCVRPSDTIARFGGDEFVVLLEDADGAMAEALAERMLSVAAFEVVLRGQPVTPSITVGIATSSPGMTAEELLRNADTALYAGKAAGKQRAEVYHASMHAQAAELLEYRADLAGALERGEFELHYQPTVALRDGALEGLEALLRWQHPRRGQVSPATFIPIAEATSQILPIGRWVLEEACRTAVRLQDRSDAPIAMHVNVSTRQLRDATIVTFVKELLEETGLAPHLLVLEVTETLLLDDRDAVRRLHELRDLGLRVAIDDFGTGYTSISYLQHLPVDILKIDRSFVSGDALDPGERAAFLNAIVHLAKSLGLHSVAEGIEEPRQRDELEDLGCDAGQGFLWSPARPIELLCDTMTRLVRQDAPGGS